MLCPEVWNFKAPESSFSSQKLEPNDNHLSTVHNFIYSHLVSVTLPDTFKVPESLTKALIDDCDYYRISNVKLSDLVEKDFVNNFVNSGRLYVLSINSRLDCDNCVALTPSGELVLNLNKSTYQSLGLEGTVSHFSGRSGDRFIVTTDLKAKHFKPGKPNYERTKKCLEQLRQNLIVVWDPPRQEVCPSSVAKYFHDLGYKTKLCEISHTTHTMYGARVPIIEDDNHQEVAEWLGMVALNAELEKCGPDSYLSSYETPEPNISVGQVKFLQWRGFFTASRITRLYNELRKIKNDPWVSMYVQGFSDSPIAWKGQEHHYYTNGDNGYVLFLTKDGAAVSCTHQCSKKRYNNKME